MGGQGRGDCLRLPSAWPGGARLSGTVCSRGLDVQGPARHRGRARPPRAVHSSQTDTISTSHSKETSKRAEGEHVSVQPRARSWPHVRSPTETCSPTLEGRKISYVSVVKYPFTPAWPGWGTLIDHSLCWSLTSCDLKTYCDHLHALRDIACPSIAVLDTHEARQRRLLSAGAWG